MPRTFFQRKDTDLTLQDIERCFEDLFDIYTRDFEDYFTDPSNPIVPSKSDSAYLLLKAMGIDELYGFKIDREPKGQEVLRIKNKKYLLRLMTQKGKKNQLNLFRRHCQSYIYKILSDKFEKPVLAKFTRLIAYIADEFKTRSDTIFSLIEAKKEKALAPYELQIKLGSHITTLQEIADYLSEIMTWYEAGYEKVVSAQHIDNLYSMVDEIQIVDSQQRQEIKEELLQSLEEQVGKPKASHRFGLCC